MKYLLWLILVLGIAIPAEATVWTVSCSTASGVQTEMNLSTVLSGDTVQCNATGQTYNWGSNTLTIPSTKSLVFDANTNIITGSPASDAAPTIMVPSTSGFQVRVTNITLNVTWEFSIAAGAQTNLPWRLDHCVIDGTVSGSSSSPIVSLEGNESTGPAPGLIDHCTFQNIGGALETIHNNGYGNFTGNTPGWIDAITPGNWQALYLETNTVSGSGASPNMIQSYNGARTVVRFNTLNGPQLDYHGNDTPPSARWFEVYNNSFASNTSDICLRGGSGIVMDNNGTSGQSTITIVDEDAGSGHGIGHGINDTSSPSTGIGIPAYMGNNTNFSENYNNSGCSVFLANGVREGVDSVSATTSPAIGVGTLANRPSTCTANVNGYIATDQGSWNTSGSGSPGNTTQGVLYKCTATNTWTLYYTPFTYPYPLTAAGFPNPTQTNCSSPSKLAFTSQPANAGINSSLGTVSVSVEDSSGVVCSSGTDSTDSITLSKDGSATWGTLSSSSSLTKAASAGVATWTDLSISATGSGSIDATDATNGSITSATSNSITINNCITSNNTWVSQSFTAQTGMFTFAFDATPSTSANDSVVALSQAAAAQLTDLATIVYFNPSDVIQVRNGGSYTQDVTLNYTGGSAYHVRMVVNLSAHTYSVYVTPPSSGETLIAANYAFRTEQASATSLGYMSAFSDTGTIQACNGTLTTGGSSGTGGHGHFRFRP